MELNDIKKYLKKYRIVRALNAVRHSYSIIDQSTIPEIRPVNCRKSSYSGKERLNLLIPSLDEQHVFGGIATALRFFEELRKECDYPARIIILDAPYVDKTSKAPSGYEVVTAEEDSAAFLQIIPFDNRKDKTIPIAKEDVFIATGWWTAYTIKDVINWQQKEFGESRPLLYCIQDYEPGFYSWSSRYLLADSTYRFEFPTYAVFNSEYLRSFMHKHGYQFAKEWCFDPILNPSLRKRLPDEGEVAKKKQILIYGRPGTERNAFSLIVYALKDWAREYRSASEWIVYSAGEDHKDIDLGNSVTLKSLGKLSLEEYARVLKESYIGISLMVSPHPSYPPLEMATFGVKTITNRYENKDLASFSSNIISLEAVSPANISKELLTLCSEYDGKGYIKYNSSYVEKEQEFGTITKEIAEALK